MAQKANTTKTAGSGNSFPPESYVYSDDVTPDVVRSVRDERGVDVKSGKWKVIDALGQVVSA